MFRARAGQLALRFLLEQSSGSSVPVRASIQLVTVDQTSNPCAAPFGTLASSTRLSQHAAGPHTKLPPVLQLSRRSPSESTCVRANFSLAAIAALAANAPTYRSAASLHSRSFSTERISELEQGDPEQQKKASEQLPSKPSAKDLDVADLLKRLNVMRFREQLVHEAEKSPTLSYQELLNLCQTSGAASTQDQAAIVCAALADAGIVLRFADIVYLRPMDIAEYIVQALPGSEKQVLDRLEHLRAELSPLEQRKHEIDRTAHRWVSMVLWGGLASFIFQWVFFLRLTFWELSWDVMEPVCYFVSSAGGIAAYCYFLATHEDFGYAPWRDRIAQNLQEGGYARKGLDLRRYQLLQRDVHRLERFLKR